MPRRPGDRCRDRGSARSLRSVGLVDEDEGRALHDGSARTDEGHPDVFHLTLPRPSGGLQRPLDDVPEPVNTPGAETPPEGVQRQLPVELDASVLDEVERLAFLAEPVGFEAVDNRGGEAIVDLRDIHVLGREARPLPGEPRRAPPAFHVAAQAADAPGHLDASR